MPMTDIQLLVFTRISIDMSLQARHAATGACTRLLTNSHSRLRQ